MVKACFFANKYLCNNEAFNLNSRDDCLYGYYMLKQMFKENNIDLSTQDINDISESQFIIYNEMPKLEDINIDKTNYLILFESELIIPNNWKKENHKYFKKVFVWNDKWVDGKKYIKYYWPNKVNDKINFDLNKKNKLCAMIAGHKLKSHPLELYSERVKAIRFFEKEHPDEFDLFGMGWDKYVFKGILSKFNRFVHFFKFLKVNYPSYRGKIDSKINTLQNYKFSICYENAKDIPGYITEKIFDSLFAGCIPVYWGAPNITDFVPSNVFIDKRNFKTYDELYKYMKNMPNSEYTTYLENIKKFLNSDKMYLFSAENFSKIIVENILKEID